MRTDPTSDPISGPGRDHGPDCGPDPDPVSRPRRNRRRAAEDGAFLFLQGPLTSFYADIAAHLLAAGRRVMKVHFCGSDVADWRHPDAIDFAGRPEGWRAFLEARFTPQDIATVILHGDRRLYHREAALWAHRHGITVAATEMGYLRPDWMTIERNACSARSHFPAEAAEIIAIAASVPPVDATPRWRGTTLGMVRAEIRHTLFNRVHHRRFPHYRSHRPFGARRIWPAWLAARIRGPATERVGRHRLDALTASDRRFFVFALQLAGDFQLRDHSPFGSVGETIAHVVASFARAAPAGSVLVLKPHPLDARPADHQRGAGTAADAHGIPERVLVIEGAPIADLCRHAAGFVTINSSAGLEALAAGCPTASVMPTIYDCAGLTHQGPLDAFWQAPAAPDPNLYVALRQALAGTIQARGTLYHPTARQAAAAEIAERLLGGRLNQPDAFVDPPPRLARAAAMGVTYDDHAVEA
ncbi:MAG: capsular biosynthesis protein [Pseudomonadota bacterium]